MSNIEIGSATERKITGILRDERYWTYNCPKSLSGSQPVDIIAIKGAGLGLSKAWFIDGKHVDAKKISFPFSDIQPNQWATMDFAANFAGIDKKRMGFAIEFERLGDIFWFPYDMALDMANSGKLSVNASALRTFKEVVYEDNRNE